MTNGLVNQIMTRPILPPHNMNIPTPAPTPTLQRVVCHRFAPFCEEYTHERTRNKSCGCCWWEVRKGVFQYLENMMLRTAHGFLLFFSCQFHNMEIRMEHVHGCSGGEGNPAPPKLKPKKKRQKKKIIITNDTNKRIGPRGEGGGGGGKPKPQTSHWLGGGGGHPPFCHFFDFFFIFLFFSFVFFFSFFSNFSLF